MEVYLVAIRENMERNPIILGVFAALIALLLVKLVKATLGSHLANFMLEVAYNLPWLAGGFVAGYKAKLTPLKNGAITGAFYGGHSLSNRNGSDFNSNAWSARENLATWLLRVGCCEVFFYVLFGVRLWIFTKGDASSFLTVL
ncbi:hypothetical protein [Pseudomonas sp. BMW13]|uniref:hypothetical protein n=1 Tax=Pseudomonas sp. BMW13 TaxID=2562590 RepID=UPI001583E5F0|nr:hypothetical protein [Pseudomonas sp. BMW13]